MTVTHPGEDVPRILTWRVKIEGWKANQGREYAGIGADLGEGWFAPKSAWEKRWQSSRSEDISSSWDPPPNHRGSSLIQTTTEIVCPPETLAVWPQVQWGAAWATQGARVFGPSWCYKHLQIYIYQMTLLRVSSHRPKRRYHVIFFSLNCIESM